MIVLYNDPNRAEVELSIEEIKALATSSCPRSEEWQALYDDCMDLEEEQERFK